MISKVVLFFTYSSCLDCLLVEEISRILQQSKWFPHLKNKIEVKENWNIFLEKQPNQLTAEKGEANKATNSAADVHYRTCWYSFNYCIERMSLPPHLLENMSIWILQKRSKTVLTNCHPNIQLKLVKGGRAEVDLDKLHVGLLCRCCTRYHLKIEDLFSKF